MDTTAALTELKKKVQIGAMNGNWEFTAHFWAHYYQYWRDRAEEAIAMLKDEVERNMASD